MTLLMWLNLSPDSHLFPSPFMRFEVIYSESSPRDLTKGRLVSLLVLGSVGRRGSSPRHAVAAEPRAHLRGAFFFSADCYRLVVNSVCPGLKQEGKASSLPG